MFNRDSFVKCVADTLKQRGYGPKRASEIIKDYKYRAAAYEQAGKPPADAALLALADTQAEMIFRVKDRAEGHRKNLSVLAQSNERVAQGLKAGVRTSGLAFDGRMHNGRGVALARALFSTVVMDERFKGINLTSLHRVIRGRYWALMNDAAGHYLKGAFGRQKGAAHWRNVADELFGTDTGDAVAKGLAQAYKRTQELMVDEFRQNGGSLRKLIDFNLPQRQNSVKISRYGGQGGKQWVKEHLDWLDWSKMRWPDGEAIAPAQREDVLKHVWSTLATDGKARIDTTMPVGRGRAIGNMMDQHRFLVYKDGASWKAMHDKYGDGTVYDVIADHIDSMSRKTALVALFGRNPELMYPMMKNIVLKHAADEDLRTIGTKGGGRAASDAEQVMDRMDVVMGDILRQNASHPDNLVAANVHATANVLTGTLLGGSLFINMAGDFVNTVNVALSNNQKLHNMVGSYFRYMLPGQYSHLQRLAGQTGYIMDETIAAAYSIERWTGPNTYGPAWSKAIGDWQLRATQLSRHTNVARMAPVIEFMGSMHRDRALPFDKLPYRAVMERHGITAAEWDVVRKQTGVHSPSYGTELLRPLDILEIKHADKHAMWMKFATMLDVQSRIMVPDSSIEARAYLRAGTDPSTLPGALMYSFSMFKNFPMTYAQQMGRRALALDSKSRVKFIAGLGTGMLLAGAVGLQFSEIRNGREPRSMADPLFWGQALLKGGGLGIWGNYLFEGVGDYQNHAAVTALGPMAGFVTDTADLLLLQPYKMIDAWDKQKEYEGNFGNKFVEYVKRWGPGTGMWMTDLVLEREIFDRLDAMFDPAGTARRQRNRIRRQKREVGNEYFLPPGERVFQ